MYELIDNVLAIAYGMMATLSSGTKKNPLRGRYVQIEESTNGISARETFVGNVWAVQVVESSGIHVQCL